MLSIKVMAPGGCHCLTGECGRYSWCLDTAEFRRMSWFPVGPNVIFRKQKARFHPNDIMSLFDECGNGRVDFLPYQIHF
jgi:hypothetical protein